MILRGWAGSGTKRRGSVARTLLDRQRESAPYRVAVAAAIVTALSAHPDSLDRCSFDPIREPSQHGDDTVASIVLRSSSEGVVSALSRVIWRASAPRPPRKIEGSRHE